MACKTCRREDMADACGPKGSKPCMCCGMLLIAEAPNAETEGEEVVEEVHNTEDESGQS